MKTVVTTGLWVLLCCQAHADGFGTATTAEIQAFGERFATDKENHGGMVVGIIDQSGRRVFAFSATDAEQVNADTVFELGSVTKVFTTLLALELERNGVWNLSDPVRLHLPDNVRLPTDGQQEIRIENLAKQDSGLPWHCYEPSRLKNGELNLPELRRVAESIDEERLFSALGPMKLQQKPGEAFQYSNVGMGLLGCAAEHATDTEYEDLISQHVTSRLRMTSTMVRPNDELASRIQPGHYTNGEEGKNVEFQAMAPAGQMFSTAPDMLTFLAANLELEESALATSLLSMQEPQHRGSARFGDTAMPWYTDNVYQPKGSRIIGHGGGGFGYLAFVGMDTLHKRGVVVLSNQMKVNPVGVGWAILQGMPLTPSNVTIFVRKLSGAGFSLESQTVPEGVVVWQAFAGSPAERAGLKNGSVIVEIEGISMAGKTNSDALKLLRGKTGTLRLKAIAPSESTPKQYKIVRGPFLTVTDKTVVLES